MALVISDRVKETTVTTGTGTITLGGAVSGFRTFASVLSNNDTTYYAIVGSNEFEVGIGTFSGSTLTRDTVFSSSNSNAKVDFAAGTKNIFITQPASKAVYKDENDTIDINTDNVTEGSTNLYFTNERVDDRVGSLLVAGDNVTLAYDDAAGTLTISATEDNLSNNDTDDLAEGSTNLYYTDTRFDTRLATKDTDDVSEGTTNLYHTTERVQDVVGGQFITNGTHTGISFSYDDFTDGAIDATVSLSPFSTSDLSEGTNLYYTTARFDSAFSGKSTSDLSEGTNLYYTTARFDSAFSGKSTSDLSEGTNLYYTTARFDSAFSGKDTDDLTEGTTNLYHTDERVDDRVSNLIQNGTGISFAYNDSLGTLTPTVSLSAFDTDNLSEGSTNLYYTDTRANSAIDARVTQSFVNALNVTAAGVQANSVALGTDTTGNYIATIAGTANKISVTGSGSESAAVTLTLPDDVQIANDLTVAGDLTVNGATTTLGTTNLEVSDNLFELNSGLTTAPVNDSGMLIQRGTSDNAVFMWDESVDKFTLGTTTATAASTGNITITTGSLVANLEGNVTGNVTGTVSSLSNHDTGDLAEGSNLYHTNERVQDLVGGQFVTNGTHTGISFAYDDAGDGAIDATVSLASFSTSDLSEGTNLYYTDARFDTRLASKSTSDLSEGTNLYYTDARVETYLDGGTSTPTFASATVSGEITANGGIALGDNDKATFGASDDLEIYHDGSNSYVRDVGTGRLYIQSNGAGVEIKNTAGTETLARFLNDGAVDLYYDNSPKLATTSTGIDVTGTATMDGLTVDGNAISTGDVGFAVNSSGNAYMVIDRSASNRRGALAFSTAATDVTAAPTGGATLDWALGVTDSDEVAGDKFYIHTDTNSSNARFVIDGSNGNVGIGTTSPSTLLELSANNEGGSNNTLRLTDTDTNVAGTQSIGALEFYGSDTSGAGAGVKAKVQAESVSNQGASYLYFTTSDTATNNQERMRIDEDGNVGIGTSSPSTKLEVDGTITFGTANSILADNNLRFKSSGAAYIDHNTVGQDINFRVSNASSLDTTAATIDSSGNVGIGTNSPSNSLTVSSGTNDGRQLKLYGPSNNALIKFDNADTSQEYSTGLNGSAFIIYDDTNSAYRFTLDSSGNVGIGTSSPSSILHLYANDPQILLDDSGTQSSITGQSGNILYKTSAAARDHVFYGLSTEVARITGDGNVGIGTSSPSAGAVGGKVLHLVNSGGTASIRVDRSDSSTSGTISLLDANSTHGLYGTGSKPMAFSTDSTERMRITSGGEVRIGSETSSSVASGSAVGAEFSNAGLLYIRNTAGNSMKLTSNRTDGAGLVAYFERENSDGTILQFAQGGTVEGNISVSGATVSYNGFSGTHESSGIPTDTEVGTVVSTIDELDTYTTGSKAGQTRADHAKIKVSDVEGDARVYGVLSKFDENDKPVVASVGIGSVKVTGACNGGDLLESNGDGTAKVQSDDIIKSKTIGKVTIGNSDAGVKLVSCVLYCG